MTGSQREEAPADGSESSEIDSEGDVGPATEPTQGSDDPGHAPPSNVEKKPGAGERTERGR